VATIGIGTPEEMAARSLELSDFTQIKVKLDDHMPIERLRAIRDARPDAELVIDVNQGWSRDSLEEYLSDLQQLGVAMVEQPLLRGDDASLRGIDSPIPIGADESLMNLAEYDEVAPFYDVINIKLDKCGGLTEALEIVKRAQRDGRKLMVGNMTGTSLSMAPGYVIGQFCEFVDIDGPMLLEKDIEDSLDYGEGGVVLIPNGTLWG
jgi:L-alanine-DL-glutamate epimerase-like enolase superfamily enzyme